MNSLLRDSAIALAGITGFLFLQGLIREQVRFWMYGAPTLFLVGPPHLYVARGLVASASLIVGALIALFATRWYIRMIGRETITYRKETPLLLLLLLAGSITWFLVTITRALFRPREMLHFSSTDWFDLGTAALLTAVFVGIAYLRARKPATWRHFTPEDIPGIALVVGLTLALTSLSVSLETMQATAREGTGDSLHYDITLFFKDAPEEGVKFHFVANDAHGYHVVPHERPFSSGFLSFPADTVAKAEIERVPPHEHPTQCVFVVGDFLGGFIRCRRESPDAEHSAG